MDVLGDGVERGEVAGVRGRVRAGRLSPLEAIERRWPLDASLPLGAENLHHQRFAKVMLRTFVATA